MTSSLDRTPPAAHDDHWIPLSDLMTGLMMLFLLIAIVYMLKVEADSAVIKAQSAQIEIRSQKMKSIAVLYERLKNELYEQLNNEFAKDLPKWGAELERDATIRFREPDVLFSIGSADLRPRFKQILDDFFPRYIGILYSETFRDAILEVRIEGHTSSFWLKSESEQDAYFQNMKLSQERTRSTLQYVMGLNTSPQRLRWLREHVTANGLSSSKKFINSDGTENYVRSQRVEFRVRTDSESRIERIIEATE